MNNFTKEELEEIVEMMRFARKQGVDTHHNLSYTVEQKASEMIKNHCDHESNTGANITIDGVSLLSCSKCKSMFLRVANE